jgi:hypothetical protein
MSTRLSIFCFPRCFLSLRPTHHDRGWKIRMVAFLIFGLTGCVGVGPPAPTIGYRASVTVKMSDSAGGPPSLERVVEFYQHGRRRRSARVEGEAVALIDRPDLQRTWKLAPTEKSFDEFRLSSSEAVIPEAPNPFGPRSRAVFEFLGAEYLGEIETRKYVVKGEAISGYAWLTKDRIPIRFDGTVGSQESEVDLEVEYSEIERGVQPAFLFAIPPNYAGYENRTQKKDYSRDEVEDGLRRLKDEARARPQMPRNF